MNEYNFEVLSSRRRTNRIQRNRNSSTFEINGGKYNNGSEQQTVRVNSLLAAIRLLHLKVFIHYIRFIAFKIHRNSETVGFSHFRM